MDSPVQSERDITKIGLKPNVLRPKLHAKIVFKLLKTENISGA